MELKTLDFLDTKRGRWLFIGAIGLFAFLFIHIFEPFGIYSSPNHTIDEIFLEVNLALVFAVFTLIFSQFKLKDWLGIKSFTYLTIVPWFLLEAVLISFVWILVSVVFDGWPSTLFTAWLENLRDYIFLMSAPYAVGIFYLNFRFQSKVVSDLNEQLKKEEVQPERLIHFSESSGNQKLSVTLADVLYLQSNDNYVTVFYRKGNAVEKMLLRNTLKQMEHELASHGIVRCHRSYMINPLNIVRKEKATNGFVIGVKDSPEITIPVSKTYTSEIEKIIQ